MNITGLEEETRPETYWDAQVRAITALRSIGIIYKLDQRIPPMKVIRQIYKLSKNKNLIGPQIAALQEALNAVSYLVQWRVHGLEPPSKDEKYVKE